MADDRAEIPQSAPPRPGEWRDVLAPEVMERYIGKHIAIVHKRVVAAGDTYEFVREEAQKLYPDETPYLAFIPPVAAGRPASTDTPDGQSAPGTEGERGASGGRARARTRRDR
ncbi:MAG TPA: DUF5678 domain-containing protein [Capsulimonadaceae bacterium]|nr:DUF5678 domain-containing protein [Capsulimonadaceae bacterium]